MPLKNKILSKFKMNFYKDDVVYIHHGIIEGKEMKAVTTCLWNGKYKINEDGIVIIDVFEENIIEILAPNDKKWDVYDTKSQFAINEPDNNYDENSDSTSSEYKVKNRCTKNIKNNVKTIRENIDCDDDTKNEYSDNVDECEFYDHDNKNKMSYHCKLLNIYNDEGYHYNYVEYDDDCYDK
jgi:hypothetical protein